MKWAAKTLIGGAICRLPGLRGYRDWLFSTWQRPEQRGPLNAVLLKAASSFWFENDYLAEPDPNRREQMKALFMGGAGGSSWAKHYDECPLILSSRVGCLPYAEACPLLFRLEETLGNGGPALVVQIGSSSGRELTWLSQRHPRHEYIGTDIYQEVVDYSTEKHVAKNVRFTLSPAKDAAFLALPANRRAVFFSSGSLNYVQPEHVEAFFSALGARGNTEMFALETCGLEPRPTALNGSRWTGNFTYTHDYRHYAEKSGLRTVECKIIEPYIPSESYPNQRGVGHYFYRGVSAP